MRWKTVCAYDGRYFLGWQSQKGGGAVQDVIETALQKIFRCPVRIHGSARTDSGVHAGAQVFHFDAEWKHRPERLLAALGTLLPEGVQVRDLRVAPGTFHALHSAKGKRYRYTIHEGRPDPFELPFCWPLGRKLDIAAMNGAARLLIGRHDFTSFAAASGRDKEDPVKELKVLAVVRRGPRVIVTAEAPGFLYKMVRSLVGGLVNVGIGKLTPEQLREILEQRRRTAVVETAPAQGLFLERVFYRTPAHWRTK